MNAASARLPREQSQSYAGDVTAAQAYDALSRDKAAQLVDVRTLPEWTFCGAPDLSSLSKQTLLISWKHYPHYAINEQFISELARLAPDKSAPLYFLCRSGGRSLDAAIAATQAGWLACYNIEDGYEGPLDANQRRGATRGWKAANLPWGQT